MIKEDHAAREFQSTSNNSANNSKREKETGVPLVTTYHPKLQDLSSLIKRNLQYFYAGKEIKKVLKSAPFLPVKAHIIWKLVN